jgi:hypothetical protein
MELSALGTVVGIIATAMAALAGWISLRERLVRAETKIETLEKLHADQRSEVQSLRDWLDGQFSELRKVLDRKADR